jgi:O-methyltransferase
MIVRGRIRLAAKYLLAPMVYRYPPCGLNPAELATYLGYLLRRRDVPGDVAEIGCNNGGTAVVASSLLRKYSPEKTYFCFDTFGGFVKEQFDADVGHGTPPAECDRFSVNSLRLVRRVLDLHGCQDVVLVKGDATKIDEDRLSPAYSVILVDVDLSEPTYGALTKFYSRLAKGGIILVDDCSEEPEQIWRAIIGYKQFCSEHRLKVRFEYGMGVIEKE